MGKHRRKRRSLAPVEAAEVRRLYEYRKTTLKTLAARFKVSQTTIWKAANRIYPYDRKAHERSHHENHTHP